MTHYSHALSRLIVDTTCMFPRLKPGDELLLQRLGPVHGNLAKDDDIACMTNDGRVILGQFCQFTGRGLILRQLARETPLHIDYARGPILHRIVAMKPARRAGISTLNRPCATSSKSNCVL